MKSILFILLILSKISFSQVSSVWLVTEINCDTCEKNKCDTLVYLENNNYKECTFTNDTLKSTYNFVGLGTNGKALKECSRTMIDSSKSKKTYFITYEDNYHWYKEIIETKNYELRKFFHEKDNLNRLDSILRRRRKPFIMYSTKYFKNSPLESTLTKYKYHISGKLRKTIYEGYNTKFIHYFTFKGKEKSRKHFQKDDGTWSLIEETAIKYLGENHYKETLVNYFSNYSETYERYTSNEAPPEYTKIIIIRECHKERMIRAKLY